MAGDWIKCEHGLSEKPEIVRMAGCLGLDRFAVAGRWCRVWEWADKNIPQEDIPDSGSAFVKMSPRDGDNMAFIDALISTPNFANAALDVGWLKFRNGQIEFPNFGRHNGETAKTRARNSKNQKKKRQRPERSTLDDLLRPVTEMSPANGDKTVTREEKRREEKSSSAYAEEEKRGGRFVPPSVEEVKAYCQERSNGIDPQLFVDKYMANGWMVGRSKMKDWKATVRTWERNEFNVKPVAESRVATKEDALNWDARGGVQ